MRKELRPATLSDLGVTKTQSSRWQKLGALDDGAFETRIATAKKRAEDRLGALSAALDRAGGHCDRPAGESVDSRSCRAGRAHESSQKRVGRGPWVSQRTAFFENIPCFPIGSSDTVFFRRPRSH
jgi:hypothetical protein